MLRLYLLFLLERGVLLLTPFSFIKSLKSRHTGPEVSISVIPFSDLIKDSSA